MSLTLSRKFFLFISKFSNSYLVYELEGVCYNVFLLKLLNDAFDSCDWKCLNCNAKFATFGESLEAIVLTSLFVDSSKLGILAFGFFNTMERDLITKINFC